MRKGIRYVAALSLLLTIGLLYLAYINADFLQSALLTGAGTFFGAFVAIALVNFYLSGQEKTYAAGPLITLLQGPINRYHNDLFIKHGRDKFGIDKWNSLLDTYGQHKGDPDCFLPEDRTQIFQMVQSRQEDLLDCIKEIEIAMSDVIAVINWSFDAKIVGAAIICKQNISEFRLNLTQSEALDEKKIVELYLDIDLSANAVLHSLGGLVGGIQTTSNYSELK